MQRVVPLQLWLQQPWKQKISNKIAPAETPMTGSDWGEWYSIQSEVSPAIFAAPASTAFINVSFAR
jgi:hypothetical protein